MTDEQYQRWKDFALRMARTCFKDRRRPDAAWIVEHVESWFYWRDFQRDWGEYNSWDQDRHPLCDHISEFYSDLGPRCLPVDSDGEFDLDREELAYDQFSDQWLGPILCCLRAGIDLACEPSVGVIGFTVCDLRRMYPEGIPDWINTGFERDGKPVDLNSGECNVPIWL